MAQHVHRSAVFTYHEQMERVNNSVLQSIIVERLQHMGFDIDGAGRRGDSGADVSVIWPERGQRFLVDIKGHAPRTEHQLRAVQAGDSNSAGRILALPHVTRGQGEKLRNGGVQYIDSGGNAWIEAPGLTVWIEGRRPSYELRAGVDRPSRAFRPVGLQVVFVLLSDVELVNAPQREIAAVAGVSLGAVSNTMAELRSSGMLGEARGERILTDRRRLVESWIGHYASTLRPSLEERRVDGPGPRWWMTSDATELVRRTGLQFGGESALEELDAGLRAEETVLYGSPPWLDVVRELRMPTSAQGLVVLRECFWDSERLGGQLTVPPLLILADAVASGDERQVEIAETRFGDLHELTQIR